MTIACIFGENLLTGLDEQFVIDPMFRAMVMMNSETYAKHLGVYFLLTGKITLAAGASAKFLARIPAGMEVHVGKLAITATTAPLDLNLYSAPTVTAVGTPVTPVNANQILNTPSVVLVYANPTTTANGATVNYTLVAGSKQDGGLGNGAFEELILAPLTDYLFVITNNSVSAADVGYDLEWIEHAQHL